MKLVPTVKLPVGTPGEELDYAFGTLLTVSKETVLKGDAEPRRARTRKTLIKGPT
jgi:hypothetical protein